ncbi:proton-conducting transporter transmembrane domain-containing protein, partial [Corynebacterium glutamicum]
MLILFLALTAAAVVAPVLIRTLGRPAFGLLALVPGIGFFWVLSEFIKGTFKDGGELLLHYAWMPSAHLNIDFRMDSLAALFSLIVLGVGALVLLYCWGYFDSNAGRLSAFGAELVAFAMAMFGLVISDNILLMYVFWEITSVLSFLLVGYYGERASSRRSAGQALMVTTLGGLAMLVGIILMGTQTGVWRFSEIPAYSSSWADVPYISAAAALILAGALSKSAIAPTHFWLPGAMAAPTPVSAYLHSAAMVKAGIYLVARLSPDLNVVG